MRVIYENTKSIPALVNKSVQERDESSAHRTPLCLPWSCVGVGGNLVAIQASRISTYLHFWSIPGVLPYKMRQHWPNPCISFFSSGNVIGLIGIYRYVEKKFVAQKFIFVGLCVNLSRNKYMNNPKKQTMVIVDEPCSFCLINAGTKCISSFIELGSLKSDLCSCEIITLNLISIYASKDLSTKAK